MLLLPENGSRLSLAIFSFFLGQPSQLEKALIVYIQLMTRPIVSIKLGARDVLGHAS
jgi:hypothetical protein